MGVAGLGHPDRLWRTLPRKRGPRMVDKGKGSSGPAGPAGSGSSADVAKGRTLLAGPSGFPGLLAALNKKEGEADSDEGGSSGGKGRTVLGLPKHFVAAAREAQQASAGPAPTGPAAPSLIIPMSTRSPSLVRPKSDATSPLVPPPRSNVSRSNWAASRRMLFWMTPMSIRRFAGHCPAFSMARARCAPPGRG